MENGGRLSLSHMEIHVTDAVRVRDFYTGVLGFLVTDEREWADGHMVFLSRDPAEHHQLVLSSGRPPDAAYNAIDHVSFRAGSLAALRRLRERVAATAEAQLEEANHGISWSLYFRDPEGNRIECFVDTPWHTPQPYREPLDFGLSDSEIAHHTENLCRSRPGFQPREKWQAQFARQFGPEGRD